MNRLFFFSAFVSLFYRFGNASRYGAPMKTCITMTPSVVAHGADPQETDAPYTIEVDMKYYNENSTVEVIVNGKADHNTIGGFLIEAREEGEVKPLGRFTDIPQMTRYLDCTGSSFGANAAEHKWGAVTHSEVVARKMVTLKWKPNPMTTGNIYFVATIAQSQTTYWLGVKSAVLKHMMGKPTQPTPNNTTDTPSGGIKPTPTGNGGMKSTATGNGGMKSTPTGNGGMKSTPAGNGGMKSTPTGNGGMKSTPTGNDGMKSMPTGNGGITNVANSIALLVLAITAKLFI